MAAHLPRRVFAAPFVLTVAAACNSGNGTPPQEPVTAPSASTSATSASASTAATPSASATTPPAAIPVEDGPTDEHWRLEKSAAGCSVEGQGHCPPNADCNPPPPRKYACPPQITHYPATITRKVGAKVCTVYVTESGACPPQTRCNPPPPQDVVVPCP